jgi:hypothetical protein
MSHIDESDVIRVAVLEAPRKVVFIGRHDDLLDGSVGVGDSGKQVGDIAAGVGVEVFEGFVEPAEGGTKDPIRDQLIPCVTWRSLIVLLSWSRGQQSRRSGIREEQCARTRPSRSR